MSAHHIRVGVASQARLAALVKRRDGYRCRKCGRARGRLEADHIVPLSKGGAHSPANMQTLCFPCHRLKSMAEGSLRGRNRRERTAIEREWDAAVKETAALAPSARLMRR